MQIISHRGYWHQPEEKNTALAFMRSFSLGFGTETDVRDFKGQLVISHDVPDENAILFSQFLSIYNRYEKKPPLAINIKADGLQKLIVKTMADHKITNYFVFDMSVPDMLGYLKEGMPTFTRQSEVEHTPAMYQDATGVWLDSFYSEWFDLATIQGHLDREKAVCIVSPELHKRNHLDFWKKLHGFSRLKSEQLILCTDFPEEASDFFYGKN